MYEFPCHFVLPVLSVAVFGRYGKWQCSSSSHELPTKRGHGRAQYKTTAVSVAPALSYAPRGARGGEKALQARARSALARLLQPPIRRGLRRCAVWWLPCAGTLQARRVGSGRRRTVCRAMRVRVAARRPLVWCWRWSLRGCGCYRGLFVHNKLS